MQSESSQIQSLLRDSLRRALADAGDAGRLASWRMLRDEIGILAAPRPEERGGTGGGFMDALVIAEELGRAAATVPFAAAAAAVALFDSLGQPDLADAVVAGERLPALPWAEDGSAAGGGLAGARSTPLEGGRTLLAGGLMVFDWDLATDLLLMARDAGDGAPVLVQLPLGAARSGAQPFTLLDGSVAAALPCLEAVAVDDPVAHGDVASDAIRLCAQHATILACAEGVGLLRAMQEQTVGYARQRKQFGKSLSAFQVIQHRLADMLIEVEQAASITLMAAHSPADPIAASSAKARVGQALRRVSQMAVQLHGGIGTTHELALSRYFRRAMVLEAAFGTTERHLHAVERLRGGSAALASGGVHAG